VKRSQGAGKDRPVYMISVAAELAGMHPQTLRIYERKRLVQPQRSSGNTRLYSDADIERLRLIQHLTQEEGVNLAGVMRIMELQVEMDRLEAELEATRAELSHTERRIADEVRALHQSLKSDIVHVPRGGIVRKTNR
jgi:MerR family transcriptional regulator/heat shock protein HspR